VCCKLERKRKTRPCNPYGVGPAYLTMETGLSPVAECDGCAGGGGGAPHVKVRISGY
jgi:hypothetical protein